MVNVDTREGFGVGYWSAQSSLDPHHSESLKTCLNDRIFDFAKKSNKVKPLSSTKIRALSPSREMGTNSCFSAYCPKWD